MALGRQNHKYREYTIDADMLLAFLRNTGAVPAEKIPDDTRVITVVAKTPFHFSLIVESNEFDELPASVIPTNFYLNLDDYVQIS